MSNAPEQDIVAYLRDVPELKPLGRIYLNQWPKTARLPLTTVQHIGDTNDSPVLARRGGRMRLQFDIYTKTDSPGLRAILKTVLRGIRGDVGGLRFVYAVIENEQNMGVDPSGTFRNMVDAIIHWEETNG